MNIKKPSFLNFPLGNKKGLLGSIVIIGFIIAVGIIFLSNTWDEIDKIKFVGQDALELSQNALMAEKSLLKMDIKSRFAFYKAIEELNFNGGHLKADCSAFNGHILWNSAEKFCYPENYDENFLILFNKNFKPYNEYELRFSGNEFFGAAKNSIQTSGVGNKVVYKTYKHFSLNHNFYFDEVIQTAKQIVEKCPTATVGKEKCIGIYIEEFNRNNPGIKMNLGSCDLMYEDSGPEYRFCVLTKKRILNKDAKPDWSDIRFALYIP